MRLQYGRALALLRAPIWQSFWREAARPGARLAQTCLDRERIDKFFAFNDHDNCKRILEKILELRR